MAVSCGDFVQLMLAVMLFLLLSLIFWFHWSHRRILSVAWKLPNLFPAWPVVGNGYLLAYGIDWIVQTTYDEVKKRLNSDFGSKLVVWIGPYPLIVVLDPEETHTLLQSKKSIERGLEPRIFSPFLGNGIISASADVWMVTRRHVDALFHSRNLELLYPMINECGRDLVTYFSAHTAPGLVDVEPILSPVVVKSIYKLVFGEETEFNLESEKLKQFMVASERVSRLMSERFFQFYAWPNWMYILLYRKKTEALNKIFKDFIVETLEFSRKRRQTLKPSANYVECLQLKNYEAQSRSDYADKRSKTMEDVYKSLQETYPCFTNTDMINEVKTMLFSGEETSRIILSSCILALAAHPDLQEKLYSEIVTVTGQLDSDVTPNLIRAMPYLDQVFKETLRRFMTVPFFSRRVQEDIRLKDWTLPQGSLVLVSPVAVHFNPKFYPDPDRFDPDRFTPENVEARGKYSFMPFGSGPRNCIGKNYSMITIKILLVHALKRFRFSTTVDINSLTLSIHAAVGFKEGYRVQIEAR